MNIAGELNSSKTRRRHNGTRHGLSLETRFWMKVNKSPGQGPIGECWEWTACRTPNGYGQMNTGNGKKDMAHRLAWAFVQKQSPPADLFVCHHCDNRGCVRPSHLYVGTQTDNMRDCARRGRNGAWTRPEQVLCGEHHGRARLTAIQVRDIRLRAQNGERQVDLAREFNLHRATINHIVKRYTWKTLP